VSQICNKDKYVRLVVRQCGESDEAFWVSVADMQQRQVRAIGCEAVS